MKITTIFTPITQFCNYNCEYCISKAWDTEAKKEQAKPLPEMLKALIKFIRNNEVANITLSGGEPMTVDRMDDIVRACAEKGTHIYMATNFSYPVVKYLEYQKTLNGNITILGSLHYTQVDYIKFINKAIEFQNKKLSKTQFRTCAMMTPETFQLIKDTSIQLEEAGVIFIVKQLTDIRTNNAFPYSAEINKYLENHKYYYKYRNAKTTGVYCKAGHQAFYLHHNGIITRCNGSKINLGCLHKEYKLLDAPTPCDMPGCRCSVWEVRGNILWDYKEKK